nr:hypothetical protein [Bacteroidota bacterium]
MGTIITFYSFKGGTGRTFALVNTSCLLAQSKNKKILLIDWDLDAPGLDQYLKPYLKEGDKDKGGLIEFMYELKERFSENEIDWDDTDMLTLLIERILDKYLLTVNLPLDSKVHYLRAGLFNEVYSAKVQNFNWRKFFKKFPEFFTHFAYFLTRKYDYVLIDARTGHTDIGGICTMLMPEKLVLVHTMNHQSIDGVVEVAKKAIEYRRNSNDLRPLVIFPLPSRVDLDEDELHEKWKKMYVAEFKKLLIESYSLPRSIKVDNYFNNVQIRHASNYSYGEKIAVLDNADTNRYSLTRAFKSFTVQMEDIGKIWEYEPFSNLDQPLKSFMVFSEKDTEFKGLFLNQIKPLILKKVLVFDEPTVPAELWESAQIRAIAAGKYDIVIVLFTENLVSESVWKDNLVDFPKSKNKFLFTIMLSKNLKLPDFLESSYQIPKVVYTVSSSGDRVTFIAKEFENGLIKLIDQ